ncbi:hypothetical protein EVAR_59315_1 [Eumeta japonica]|uniref:Uncharacterized protein n=1 Tax=Eumeta variegata TaxID=151549 RepID=A0A4C1Y8C1_EUMVA|nr:hypothetical protein EVAR_59315_1 [Eumeta japonica]
MLSLECGISPAESAYFRAAFKLATAWLYQAALYRPIKIFSCMRIQKSDAVYDPPRPEGCSGPRTIRELRFRLAFQLEVTHTKRTERTPRPVKSESGSFRRAPRTRRAPPPRRAANLQ